MQFVDRLWRRCGRLTLRPCASCAQQHEKRREDSPKYRKLVESRPLHLKIRVTKQGILQPCTPNFIRYPALSGQARTKGSTQVLDLCAREFRGNVCVSMKCY